MDKHPFRPEQPERTTVSTDSYENNPNPYAVDPLLDSPESTRAWEPWEGGQKIYEVRVTPGMLKPGFWAGLAVMPGVCLILFVLFLVNVLANGEDLVIGLLVLFGIGGCSVLYLCTVLSQRFRLQVDDEVIEVHAFLGGIHFWRLCFPREKIVATEKKYRFFGAQSIYRYTIFLNSGSFTMVHFPCRSAEERDRILDDIARFLAA